MQDSVQPSLELQLNETSYQLVVTSIKDDINSINEVFAQNFPEHTLTLFNIIKQSDSANIGQILLPLQHELSENFPSVKAAIQSCKRLNNLVTKNVDEIISIYTLDRITNLPDRNSIEFKNLFESIKNFVEERIDANIHGIENELSLQGDNLNYTGPSYDLV